MHPHQGRLPQGRLSSEAQPGRASNLKQSLHGITPVDQDRHLEAPRSTRVAHPASVERARIQGGRDADRAVHPLRATVGAKRPLGHLLLADLEDEAHLRLDLLKLSGTSAVDASRASVGEILTLDVDRNRPNAQIADTGAHLTSLVQVGSEIGVGGLPIIGGRSNRATLDLGDRLPLRHGKEAHRASSAVSHDASRVHIIVTDIRGVRDGGRRPPNSSR